MGLLQPEGINEQTAPAGREAKEGNELCRGSLEGKPNKQSEYEESNFDGAKEAGLKQLHEENDNDNEKPHFREIFDGETYLGQSSPSSSSSSPPYSRTAHRNRYSEGHQQHQGQSQHQEQSPNAQQGSRDFLCKKWLREQDLKVEVGKCINLLEATRWTADELRDLFEQARSSKVFRGFGGRFIWDHKIFDGAPFVKMPPPFEALDQLVESLVALAWNSIGANEELAVLQVLVNLLGGAVRSVKPHRHRCRQICLSLGTACTVEMEGKPIVMENGDCLHMGGEVHSVPQDPNRRGPRVSVCLFYGTKTEFEAGSLAVAADGGFHWTHPDDKETPAEPPIIGEYDGVVKFVSDVFDYAIITSEALLEQGHQEAFVKKKKVTRLGADVGSNVRFDAYLNKRGVPQVKNLSSREGPSPSSEVAG